MEITMYYKVYQLSKIMDSKQLSLEEVKFKGFTSNMFATEKLAVQALVDDRRFWQNYIILKEVHITNYE